MSVCSECKQELIEEDAVFSDKSKSYMLCAECYEQSSINDRVHSIENDRGLDND